MVIEAANRRTRPAVTERRPVIDAIHGHLPLIVGKLGDVVDSITIKICDDEARHGVGQFRAKALPRVIPLRKNDHPLIVNNTYDVCFWIVFVILVKMTKREIGNLEARGGIRHEGTTAAVRDKPLITTREKDVGPTIANEIADDEVSHAPLAVVDFFPRGNATPGDHPIFTDLRKNIGAAIAVEVSEEEVADGLFFCAQEAPFGRAAGRIVPGGTGCQKQVIIAVAIEVANPEGGRPEADSGIG